MYKNTSNVYLCWTSIVLGEPFCTKEIGSRFFFCDIHYVETINARCPVSALCLAQNERKPKSTIDVNLGVQRPAIKMRLLCCSALDNATKHIN